MTALAANINATQTLIPVDAGLTNGSFKLPLYYTIGSEAILVTGRAHRTTWLVERGIAGTTAASHSSGATLTRYYPEAAATAGGAGGVTVDNQDDPPAEITTLVAPGATISGDEATLGVPAAATGNEDDVPRVTAGVYELRSPAVALAEVLAVGADTGGVLIEGVTEGVENAQAGFSVQALVGEAAVLNSATATEARAYIDNTALNAGDEDAAVNSEAQAQGAGAASINLRANRGGVIAGMEAIVDVTSARMGFFNANPVARPEVPASPTEQDIVDALVALGLITQGV